MSQSRPSLHSATSVDFIIPSSRNTWLLFGSRALRSDRSHLVQALQYYTRLSRIFTPLRPLAILQFLLSCEIVPMAATFSFPSRQLYGVSIDVNAPFRPQLQTREQSRRRGENLYSLNEALVGTWELILYYAPAITDSEDIFYPLGRNAKGMIMYNADGYMTASLLRPGQPQYNAPEPGSASPGELAESSKRYLGYTGPFYLDESGERPIVRHIMRLVNFPNWIGNVQTRVIDLSGDKLTLGLESVVEMAGVRRNPLLVFVRAPRNDVTGTAPEQARGPPF